MLRRHRTRPLPDTVIDQRFNGALGLNFGIHPTGQVDVTVRNVSERQKPRSGQCIGKLRPAVTDKSVEAISEFATETSRKLSKGAGRFSALDVE